MGAERKYDYEAIYADYKAGIFVRDISKKYGCSRERVTTIIGQMYKREHSLGDEDPICSDESLPQ